MAELFYHRYTGHVTHKRNERAVVTNNERRFAVLFFLPFILFIISTFRAFLAYTGFGFDHNLMFSDDMAQDDNMLRLERHYRTIAGTHP